MNYYKRLAVLIAVIAVISGTVVYLTSEAGLLQRLTAFRPEAVLLAVAFLILGMYFDAARLVTLVRITGQYISLLQAMQVILSNYFLSMLTPGATGGPVAQVLFLRRLGMPAGQATVVVLVRTTLSILFLVVCLPLVLFSSASEVLWLRSETANGIVAALAGLVGVGVWFARTSLMTRFVIWLAQKLSKPQRRRVGKLYGDIRESLRLLLSSPKDMARVFVETALSLLCLYAIVPALFLGLGVKVDWPLIMGRMIVLNFLLYFAPTPGGSGVAEGGFVFLFNSYVPAGTVGALAVAWRILAEYMPFLAGMYFTLKAFGAQMVANKRAA